MLFTRLCGYPHHQALRRNGVYNCLESVPLVGAQEKPMFRKHFTN